MRNQFFYTVPNEDPKDEKVIRGSFNLGKVIRTVEYEPKKLVVLLDDFHPETRNVPVPGKNGKVNLQKMTDTMSSQVFLNEEDSARYEAITAIA